MFKKFAQNKYSLLLLAVYVVALYVILNKAIIPFVLTVVESDVLTGDVSQSGQVTEIHDNRTQMALLQCNRFVKDKFSDDTALVFANATSHSWDIGYGRFLIKSYVDVTEAGEPTIRKNYVCQIKHTGGNLDEQANWDLSGLALNDVKMASAP